MDEQNDPKKASQGQEKSPGNGDDQDEARFNELAALSPAEYDRRREDEAKKLGIRISTLDEEVKQRRSRAAEQNEAESASLVLAAPKPWDEPVDGAELLDEMLTSMKLYVVFPPGAAEAIVLWCIFAHAHDAARHSPVLAITSPEKRCGKTTALAIIEHLVPKPLQSSNITTAVIFRVVEKWSPTLLIDEADTFLSDKNDMRGVLNSGHRRSSAMIYRCVGDEHEPIGFRTWAPKAIAMIGDLPDTLADRAINIRLRRRLPDEAIADLDEPAEAKLQILCRKAARWVADQFAELKKARPSFPDGLQDRANDNWRTMLAIAELAGGEWPERARNAALTLSRDDSDEGPASVMLLADIRTVFGAKTTDVLPTTAILSGLWKMHDRPWPQWYRGQTITARGLSKLLTPFGIKPQSVRIGDKTPKGYRREWFQDAWKRYLPLIPPK